MKITRESHEAYIREYDEFMINTRKKMNQIIKLLQSPDLDDYECCIEIAKVVGIYNYEREDKRD